MAAPWRRLPQEPAEWGYRNACHPHDANRESERFEHVQRSSTCPQCGRQVPDIADGCEAERRSETVLVHENSGPHTGDRGCSDQPFIIDGDGLGACTPEVGDDPDQVGIVQEPFVGIVARPKWSGIVRQLHEDPRALNRREPGQRPEVLYFDAQCAKTALPSACFFCGRRQAVAQDSDLNFQPGAAPFFHHHAVREFSQLRRGDAQHGPHLSLGPYLGYHEEGGQEGHDEHSRADVDLSVARSQGQIWADRVTTMSFPLTVTPNSASGRGGGPASTWPFRGS